MKRSSVKKKNKEREVLTESKEWESGKRGRGSAAATVEDEANLDKAMELQMISIRLPQAVVAKLKSMAKKEGIGYQPYTRQILIHHTQQETGKLHDLEERLRSVEKVLFRKSGGR
jgi:predicted DNA binding CopG/RHH family protein